MKFVNKDLLLKHQLAEHVKSKPYQMAETTEVTRNISVLDMTEDGAGQVNSYEVTIDNSVLDSLTE